MLVDLISCTTIKTMEHNDPVPVEQVKPTPPIVEPLNLLDALPIEMFRIIMDLLELWEQFTVRRVCHSWKDKIEECMFFDVPKECLKLNVKKAMIGQAEQGVRCVRTWEPNESIHRMCFEFAYKAPSLAPSEEAHISIWDRAFNLDAAQAIGRMFLGVKTLIIYWDTDDSEESIDSLVLMLSQFKELDTFGLITTGQMTNSETLAKICTAINAHLAPLKQLHLMLPSLVSFLGIKQRYKRPARLQPSFDLDKAVESVTNFTLNSNVQFDSYLKILCSGFGQKLAEPSSSQLEGLSIPFCCGHDQTLILNALELNKAKFVGVKRLLVMNITSCKSVQQLLVYFPNLEQLALKYSLSFGETFDDEWICALKPLSKLTELTLFDFNFERKLLGWGWHRYHVDETANLNQLRKLTITRHNLFFCLRRASNPIYDCRLIPQLKPEDIGDTIRMRFPGLQELHMWSGDAELHQTAESAWQELEQSLNCELSLHSGLRVDIQLRHPMMYQQYIVQSAFELASNRRTIAESNAYRLRRVPLDDLLERRPHFADLTDDDRRVLDRAFLEVVPIKVQDEILARANIHNPFLDIRFFDLLLQEGRA